LFVAVTVSGTWDNSGDICTALPIAEKRNVFVELQFNLPDTRMELGNLSA
jgi:hypothetical protein